jgi:hypothetical protein
LTRTASQSRVIGTGYASFGLLGLVLCALGGGHIWYLFFSLVWLVLGSIYLASAAARYRRERSRRASRTAVPPGLPRPSADHGP